MCVCVCVCVRKLDLTLNNPLGLIFHKTNKPTKQQQQKKIENTFFMPGLRGLDYSEGIP